MLLKDILYYVWCVCMLMVGEGPYVCACAHVYKGLRLKSRLSGLLSSLLSWGLSLNPPWTFLAGLYSQVTLEIPLSASVGLGLGS